MTTICIACNDKGYGMISVYRHPHKIDEMFTNLTGVEILVSDALCITCYDEMKIANNFRLKCIESHNARHPVTAPAVQEDKIEPNKAQSDNVLLNGNEHEISTTSLEAEATALSDEEVPEQQSPEDEEVAALDDSSLSGSKLEEVAETVNEVSSELIVLRLMDVEEEVDNVEQLEQDEFEVLSESLRVSEDEEIEEHLVEESITPPSTEIFENNRKKRGRKPKNADDDIFTNLHENTCEFCFETFACIYERRMHEADHKSEARPYQCTFENCTSRFKNKSGLRIHARIHSDVKPYECRFCDRKFNQKANIVMHERSHTGERPFLCPVCGKGFADSGNLKSHIRYHTGEKPFQCSECKKFFGTHYSHKVHMRTHTKERPFLCNVCGKTFTSSGKLLVHKRIHTGHRPYKCDLCSAAFHESCGLNRHKRNRHIPK